MNDYEAPPNQKLNTTSSPTFAGLTITGTATFASTVTVTGQIKAADGTSSAPGISFSGQTTLGLYRRGTDRIQMTRASNSPMFDFYDGSFVLPAAGAVVFTSTANADSGYDLYVRRLAAASLRIGNVSSATPVAHTLTIGEASRPGTDTDVGGASATIRSGLGTGTGTPSKIVLITPTAVASGSTVQTYDSCFVALGGITSSFPAIRRSSTKIEGVLADESNYCAFRGSAFFDANNVQVLGAQGAAVADATGAGDVVAQLNALLARCRAHGLIAT